MQIIFFLLFSCCSRDQLLQRSAPPRRSTHLAPLPPSSQSSWDQNPPVLPSEGSASTRRTGRRLRPEPGGQVRGQARPVPPACPVPPAPALPAELPSPLLRLWRKTSGLEVRWEERKICLCDRRSNSPWGATAAPRGCCHRGPRPLVLGPTGPERRDQAGRWRPGVQDIYYHYHHY